MPASRAAICLLITACATSVMGQSKVAAESLEEAAKARQDAAKSLEVEIKVKEFQARGSVSEDDPVLKARPSPTPMVIPAVDTTVESTNRLVIDGVKVRYENNHPLWHIRTGELHPTAKISASNGQVSKIFLPRGLGK